MPMTGKTADPCNSVCYPSGTKSGSVWNMVVTSQLCWYFRPNFVNCCPLTFSLVQLFPPFCVNKYTYTRIQCERGGYRVLGPTQRNTCCKVPLKVNYFSRRQIFLLSMSLIFLRSKLSFCMNMLVVKHKRRHLGFSSTVYVYRTCTKGYCLCIKSVHVTYS
jgi:hypothetical protein